MLRIKGLLVEQRHSNAAVRSSRRRRGCGAPADRRRLRYAPPRSQRSPRLTVPRPGQIARDSRRENAHVPGEGRLRPAFVCVIGHLSAALVEFGPVIMRLTSLRPVQWSTTSSPGPAGASVGTYLYCSAIPGLVLSKTDQSCYSNSNRPEKSRAGTLRFPQYRNTINPHPTSVQPSFFSLMHFGSVGCWLGSIRACQLFAG